LGGSGLNQHDYVKGAQSYNTANGDAPYDDSNQWEDAHYPRPKGSGEEKTPLTFWQHQVQGLLQSEEEGRKCFFEGHTRAFLRRAPFFEGLFDLWDIYDKWKGNPGRTGKATYRNTETGETAWLNPEEAAEMGWVHVRKGLAVYEDPMSGERQSVTAKEAADRGLVHIHTGTSNYLDPETGLGIKLSTEEGKERGLTNLTAGKACYRNPVTGETARLTPEQAEEEGWVSSLEGRAPYKDPETGETASLTRLEAEARGWVGVNKGRKLKMKKVVCPHCGKNGSGPAMTQYHSDNCDQREGSWRWFKKEMKGLTQKLKEAT
jgi:hypothetical protein